MYPQPIVMRPVAGAAGARLPRTLRQIVDQGTHGQCVREAFKLGLDQIAVERPGTCGQLSEQRGAARRIVRQCGQALPQQLEQGDRWEQRRLEIIAFPALPEAARIEADDVPRFSAPRHFETSRAPIELPTMSTPFMSSPVR